MNLTSGMPFGDGEHILYINGEYRGDSDIGRLMHDFNCSSPDDMYFETMAEAARYLKENPKGVSQVCKILEDMRKEYWQGGKEEGRAEGKEEGRYEGRNEEKQLTVLRMLETGRYAIEEISSISGLSPDEVKKLSEGRTA